MQKNYKQVMQGIGDRQTQRSTGIISTSKLIPNTNRGKHKKTHTDRSKQNDVVTKWRSLLNEMQRKIFPQKNLQKEVGAYTLLYYHGHERIRGM